MSRRGLEVLAVILTFLIVIVLFAGFDNLPRKVRADIAAEAQQLPQTQKQFQSAQDEVTHDLSSDPDLFRAHDMNTAFPEAKRCATTSGSNIRSTPWLEKSIADEKDDSRH